MLSQDCGAHTGVTILTAAQTVLAQAEQGLHVYELTEQLLASGLWTTQGKTPRATVEAALAADIKARGAASPFVRLAPRTYGLRTPVSPDPPATVAVPPPPTPESVPPVPGLMTFLDAAAKVLADDAKGQPMHYRAVTERAIARGLIPTRGRTPEATMYAQIITDVERRQKRGERSRFTRHGRGLVGLSSWETSGLAGQIERHNREVQHKLTAQVHKLSPADFELLVGRLLGALGFEAIQVTKLSGDGGIDVRGTLVVGDAVRIQMAVQAKRWKANVQAPTVQQVRGSLGAHEQGLIITTSDFSAGARTEAGSPGKTPVGLMNGENLVKLLIEHDILVRRASYDLLELDLSDSVNAAP
jgi:restriction system protein